MYADWPYDKLFCERGQVCFNSNTLGAPNECRNLEPKESRTTQKTRRFSTPEDPSDFPEVELVASRPNIGIAASGGGSRAYSSALGVFRALNQLKVKGSEKTMMENVRYISVRE